MKAAGVCILRTGTTQSDAVRDLASQVSQLFLRDRLAAAGRPVEVTAAKQRPSGIEADEAFVPHTDGHAYGDYYPDVFLLLCEQPAASGGSNYVVDGYALMDEFRGDAEHAWVAEALEHISIDQSSRVACVSPAVQSASTTAASRRQWPSSSCLLWPQSTRPTRIPPPSGEGEMRMLPG